MQKANTLSLSNLAEMDIKPILKIEFSTKTTE